MHIYYIYSYFSYVMLWTAMGFSRQEYWSGLPFLSPGDLPNLGIEFAFPVVSALQVDSLLLSLWGSP